MSAWVVVALCVVVGMLAAGLFYLLALLVSWFRLRAAERAVGEHREALQWAAFIGDFTTEEVTAIATIAELYEVSR